MSPGVASNLSNLKVLQNLIHPTVCVPPKLWSGRWAKQVLISVLIYIRRAWVISYVILVVKCPRSRLSRVTNLFQIGSSRLLMDLESNATAPKPSQ